MHFTQYHRGVQFNTNIINFVPVRGGGLPYKRLMGMCCLMGSHFHGWIDYNGVAFSIELLEWSRTFLDFWVRKFFTFMVSECTRMFVL